MSQSIGVDADDPPLRIFFGDGPLSIVTADYESRLEDVARVGPAVGRGARQE